MKKKKNTKKIIIIVVSILLFIAIILSILFYMNNDKSGYTLLEKKWISNNKNNTITVKVDNNLPMFSYAGEGIYYDYIKDFNEDTELNIDPITTSGADYEFVTNNKRNNNNVLFYTDHYVVVSKLEKQVHSIDELKSTPLGVIKEEMSDIAYYFSDEDDINLKSYENFNELNTDLGNQIDYMIIPKTKYLEQILTNDYTISYHLDGLNQYYELQVKSNNKELNSVMQKFLNQWQKKKNEKYNEYSLNFYVETKDIDQLKLETITKTDLILGYINNLPYEGKIQRKFTGLTNEYIKGFSAFTGSTFKYEKYDNKRKLVNDLNADKVDIVFNQNNLSNVNYKATKILDMPKYVVLTHDENDMVVSNIYSLKDYKVTMLKSNNLTSKLNKKNIFTIKTEENTKEMFKNMDEDSIILVDSIVYETYKRTKLKNYSIRYESDNLARYNFLINKNDEVLIDLFNYYISVNSNKEIAYQASYNTEKDIKGNTIFGFIVNNIIFIGLLILIVLFIIWKYRNRIKVKKKIKKEDKMMYIDVMTNLKNRNYLNDNMEIWDNNKVYPQAVILIDVNDIKEINDTEGHEEGDRQIKAVANILINTQRENSEIIRSDGNEFLIYMIGYEEKVITTYMHKLNKEFKTLPYDNGVHFGYSMITSEIKSLDDAINESLSMIKEQEEK